MMSAWTWLLVCGALAAGEFAAVHASGWATAWPMVAVLAVFVALCAYGFWSRGWLVAFAFLLGFGVYLFASVGPEQFYRENPWMRGKRLHVRQAESSVSWVEPVRDALSKRIGIGLERDAEVVGLHRAILLGERRCLSRQMKRVFVDSGTIHVFAISGLHVMAVAKVLMLLLAFLFVPRRLIGALSIPLLWGYVAVIGFSPSAVRAAAMATFYCLAPVFWRKPDALMAWVMSFLVVHLAAPRMIDDVGNALSFTVMLAIILSTRVVRDLDGWKMKLWVTFIAWMAGVPIAAHVFGRVTPGGMLANLVLIFAAEWSVVSGVIGLVASFVSTPLAVHCNNLAALLTKSMVGVAELVSRLPGSNFEVPRWSYLQCAEWYALIGLLMYLVHSIRQRRADML